VLRGEEILIGAPSRAFHLFAAILLALLLPGSEFSSPPWWGRRRAPRRAILAAVGSAAARSYPDDDASALGWISHVSRRPLRLLVTSAGRLAARIDPRGSRRGSASRRRRSRLVSAPAGLKGNTARLLGSRCLAHVAARRQVYFGQPAARAARRAAVNRSSASTRGQPGGLVAIENGNRAAVVSASSYPSACARAALRFDRAATIPRSAGRSKGITASSSRSSSRAPDYQMAKPVPRRQRRAAPSFA